MNVSNWLEKHADFQPEKIALRIFKDPQSEETWNYSFLCERSRSWAKGLKHLLGVGRGDRVAFLGYNHPDMLALMFACARLGAILVPLNWRLAPPEHAFISKNAGIHVLIVEKDFIVHAQAIKDSVPECDLVSLDFFSNGWISHTDLMESEGLDDSNPNVGHESPWMIVYTSGTTGHPKGAVLTQEALFWNALNSIHLHELRHTDRILSVLPFFHVGPLNIQTTPALYVGAEVVMCPRFDPELTLNLINSTRPDLLLLVPVTMQALLRNPMWEQTDFSCLRLVVTGSSVVPQNLIEGFHQRGVPVGQVYGSTETTPIAAVLRKEDAYSKAGSTGKPALHCDVKIVDDSGMELPPHESGELWVKGPNLMFEYWGDPKATSEAFREGWFQSGDIGFRDEEGFITINDRKKDIIISGGENIYPAEVESILRKLDAVADVAVVGRKDLDWGEVPFAYIELKSGMTFDEMETRKICSEQLARFKNPKSYIVLEQLPRNTMGKVLKYQLRENAKTLN